MARIILRKRLSGVYKYVNCPKCYELVEIGKPIEADMPYCSECGKIVLDAAQHFCCWCGEKFEEKEV